VLDDLDHVVDRVTQHDPRLRPVRGEDQVLQLALDPTQLRRTDQSQEVRVVKLLGHRPGHVS